MQASKEASPTLLGSGPMKCEGLLAVTQGIVSVEEQVQVRKAAYVDMHRSEHFIQKCMKAATEVGHQSKRYIRMHHMMIQNAAEKLLLLKSDIESS